MWQYVLVTLIVLAATLFAIWRLPGDATRRHYISVLRRVSGGRGPLDHLALRLERRISRAAGLAACSNCSSAADHDKPTPPTPGR